MQRGRGCGATCHHGGENTSSPRNLVRTPCFGGRHFFALLPARSQDQTEFLISGQPKLGTTNPAIVGTQEGRPVGRGGLRSASSGHRSQGCHTSGDGVRDDAPSPAGLLSPSADPSTPEESPQAPPALRLPTSARQTGKPAPSRTVLLWGTSWLLSPGDVPHLAWGSHGRGTQRPCAPGQGLSPASGPISRSPQGDAQVSPVEVVPPSVTLSCQISSVPNA